MTRAELNDYILEKLPDNILKLILPLHHRQVENAILDYVDEGFDNAADALSTGLATKVSNSTYNAGLASQAAVNSNFSVIIGTLFEGLTYRGTYPTFEALETALPGPPGDDYASGDYAVVDNGTDPAVSYIWDIELGWIVGSPPTAVTFVTGTKSEIDDLIDDDLLKPGATYFITEMGSGSLRAVILKAISTSKFEKAGLGLFEVPSFAQVDISADPSFSGCPIPATDFKGVWTVELEAFLVNGDVVQLGGKHFQVTTAGAMDGTGPTPGAVANGFTPLDFGTANVGYTVETDIIEYDYQFGQNTLRIDKRNNVIRGADAITVFQWGNNDVANNVIFPGSTWNCIDQRGIINKNEVHGEINVYTSSRHAGVIERTHFGGRGHNINASKLSSQILGCHIVPPDDYGDITLDEGTDDIERTLTGKFSDFIGFIGASGDEFRFADPGVSHYGIITGQEDSNTIINKIRLVDPTTLMFEMSFEIRADVGRVLRFRPTQPVDVADNYAILFPGNSNAILTLDGDKQQYAKFRARIMSLPGGVFFVVELLETNAVFTPVQTLEFFVSQAGTANPNVTISKNTIDPDLYTVWAVTPYRLAPGFFKLPLDDTTPFIAGKTVFKSLGFSQDGSGKRVLPGIVFGGTNTLIINTQTVAGVQADDVLNGDWFQLEIYP